MRKRLSLQSKIGLSLADRTIQQSFHARDRLPNVFASRHGEYPRTYSIIEGLAEQELPSPAAFSQSVHNTAAGLWSIAAECAAPSITIASGEATLYSGFFEAASLSEEITGPVLFVYSDVPLPSRYGDQDRIGAAVGFAAVVDSAKEDGTAITYKLDHRRAIDNADGREAVEHVAGLVQLLIGNAKQACLNDGRIAWEFS